MSASTSVVVRDTLTAVYGGIVRHFDYQMLLKIVVIVSAAVVIVYASSLGYLDFISSQTIKPTTPAERQLANGDYTGAAQSYRDQVQALEGNLVDAYLGLAAAYNGEKQSADAEAIYRKVIVLDPTAKKAYLGLARLLIEQGRIEESKPVISAAIEQFPTDVDFLKLDDDINQPEE